VNEQNNKRTTNEKIWQRKGFQNKKKLFYVLAKDRSKHFHAGNYNLNPGGRRHRVGSKTSSAGSSLPHFLLMILSPQSSGLFSNWN